MPRVLIAEDEESMRMLVKRAIAMDGHDIVAAQDGAEALEILNRDDGYVHRRRQPGHCLGEHGGPSADVLRRHQVRHVDDAQLRRAP